MPNVVSAIDGTSHEIWYWWNLWLSLFINFLFISIDENNWFAESMFFVGVHWMEFVSHVKFRQLQTQRTTFVNCFSSSMIMRFTMINNTAHAIFIYLFIYLCFSIIIIWNIHMYQGRIQDFKLRGGALKKIAPSGGRRENVGGISCLWIELNQYWNKMSFICVC
jgi:hypothetical protein